MWLAHNEMTWLRSLHLLSDRVRGFWFFFYRYMPIIPALQTLRQENCEFKARLSYIARPSKKLYLINLERLFKEHNIKLQI